MSGARRRVLVTGAAGMLGSQLLLDAPSGVDVIGTDLLPSQPERPPVVASGFDLTSREGVAQLFERHGPFDGAIHAAAYTAVDTAETAEGRAAAWSVNVTGVAELARIAAAHGITLVHVSSDYVFDGTAARPMRTTRMTEGRNERWISAQPSLASSTTRSTFSPPAVDPEQPPMNITMQISATIEGG